MKSQNVVVIGSWHLGSVIGTCLADVGQNVYLWDQSPRVRESWSKGHPPIHEPGLEELVKKNWGTTLFWSDDLKKNSAQSDWVVLAYDTPINNQDEVILDAVYEGFDAVLNAGIKNDTRFFLTSQLPVGTSRTLRKKILNAYPQWTGEVVYQPENLRLGDALKSFTNPDRMVLGVENLTEPAKAKTIESFCGLLQNTKTPLNVMSLESSEMVKHALNSFLATCVVFANEISDICEKSEASAWDVMGSLKQDSRVGPKAFLRPGLGFAGGTLARDVKTLSKLVNNHKTSNLFKTLYSLNDSRNDWVVEQLESKLSSLDGEKIVLLGITYKPGTSTVRRSPALDIANLLKSKGAHCVALDPMADLDELTNDERKGLAFNLEKSTEVAFKDASAAVLVTEWDQFKNIDWSSVQKLMKTSILIDTKNFLISQPGVEKFKTVVPGK
jgi:UDPglucose 6-dehydrogenase